MLIQSSLPFVCLVQIVLLKALVDAAGNFPWFKHGGFHATLLPVGTFQVRNEVQHLCEAAKRR